MMSNNKVASKQISPFHRLKDPPSISLFPHDAICYCDIENCIIIATTSHALNGGILKYDLDEQVIAERYPYPSNLTVQDPYCQIDKKKRIIYVLHDYGTLLSFDLKSKQFNTSICYDETDFANIVFIPSPINQLHLTMDNIHYKLDENNKSLIKLHDNIGSQKDIYTYTQEWGWHDVPAEFIYNSTTKQLIMFQTRCSEDILICDINTKNQQSFEWKKYSTKLFPEIQEDYQLSILLGWDQIVFVFNFKKIGHGTIWCLDILHIDKWFKSHHKIPQYAHFAIMDKENNGHLICFTENKQYDFHAVHYKIALYDLLPLEIIKLNTKRYDPLVIGYVKQCEKENQFPFIPFYIKQLILKFYPIFI